MKKNYRRSRWHLAGYGLIFLFSVSGKLGCGEILVAADALTKPVHQLQNTIEHLGLSHEADILNNTRSTRTNALMRWLS